MSEHATQEPSRPEVQHESSDVNLKGIVWGGIAIVVGMAATGLVCWGLLAYYGGAERQAAEKVPVLTREVAERSLADQIASLPGPRLEGLEMAELRLVLTTGPGQSRAFAVGPLTRYLWAGKEVSLEDLGEGTRAAVVFREENGIGRAVRVVIPPEDGEAGEGEQLLTGTVARVEARDIAERRRQMEARRDAYGWVEKKKGIARLPVARAREAILTQGLKGKWLPARPEPEKGDKE